jgi:hypothetical protein
MFLGHDESLESAPQNNIRSHSHRRVIAPPGSSSPLPAQQRTLALPPHLQIQVLGSAPAQGQMYPQQMPPSTQPSIPPGRTLPIPPHLQQQQQYPQGAFQPNASLLPQQYSLEPNIQNPSGGTSSVPAARPSLESNQAEKDESLGKKGS